MSELSSGTIVDPAKYRGKVLGAAIAGYAFDGFDIMVLALTMPVLFREWASAGFNMVQAGLIGTAMLFGMSLGGYVFGPIADKFGRKKGLIWCIAFFGITTGLAGFAQDYLQLAALRFLAGLGLGAEYALGGTLVQEFYPPEKRGKLSSWVQMGWPIGFGSAVVAQYFMMPIWGWRSLYFLGMSAILVSAYIKFFVPESPVWLKAQEDKKKGVTGTSAAPAAGLTDLFKSHNIRVFFIVALFFTSMLITYWSVNTWLPTILARERGMNPKEYSGFMMFMQFAAIISYLIAGIIADKFGKRITMAVCAFLSAVTLYVWLGMQWDATVFWVMGTLNWACASAVWAIAMGFVVEQFPTNIRAVGFASAYSTGRLLSTIVPIVMGAAAQKIGLTQVMASVSVFYLIAMIAILLLKETKAQL